MMPVVITIAVCVSGGIGAGLRLTVDGLINERHNFVLPLGTMIINVIGSLVLGVLIGLTISHPSAGIHRLELIAGTGVMGGFTTFSTASVEVVRLALQRRFAVAALHALGTLILSVAAATLGIVLTS